MDKILDILESNGRASVEKIAQVTGRSADEVQQVIEKLEREKVILGYRAVIDSEKRGQSIVSAFIEVRITPEKEGGFDRMAEKISQFKEVRSCYLMSGGYDLLVLMEGKDLKQVAQFVSEKLAMVEGVISTATRFMLKSYKENGMLFKEELSGEKRN